MVVWQRAYDADIQQHYFINTEDNSISYDLPCEVQYTPENRRKSLTSLHFPSLKKKKSASSTSSGCPLSDTKSPSSSVSGSSSMNGTSVFAKITSALSRRSSFCSQKSRSHQKSISRNSSRTLFDETPVYTEENSKTHTFNIPSYQDSDSIISGLDDELLLVDPVNYGYESRTSQRNYLNGYMSVDNDSEESIHSYYSELARDSHLYEEESIYDLEKERERLELRIQMRQELET